MDQKPEKQIAFLLKTMRREYLYDTMVKGRFYFCHPSVFSKWEDTTAAQYDRWDAHSSYKVMNMVLAPIIGEKDGMPIYGRGERLDGNAIVHMQSGAAKHSPICCFRCVKQNEVQFVENGILFSLGGTAERIKREFGHEVYVLIEARPFIERLKRKVDYFLAMEVSYCDVLNDYPFHVDEQYREIVEQLFRKDKKYEWQKEYRIALAPSKASPVFIELGSIGNIAVCGNIDELKD